MSAEESKDADINATESTGPSSHAILTEAKSILDKEEKDKEVYLKLNDDFDSTIKKLRDKGSVLEKFCEEYSKLHKLLRSSQGTKNQWSKKVRELIEDIKKNKDNIASAKREEDELTQEEIQLETEIARTWRKVNDSHEAEKAKRAIVEDLKKDNEALSNRLNRGSGWTEEQERLIAGLRRQVSDLKRDQSTKVANFNGLKTAVAGLEKHINDEEATKEELENTISLLKDQISSKRDECTNEQRRKDKLDGDLKQLNTKVETAGKKMAERKKFFEEKRKRMKELSSKLEAARQQMESFQRMYDVTFQRSNKLGDNLADQQRKNDSIKNELATRKTAIADFKAEAKQLQKDIDRIKKKIGKKISEIEDSDKERARLENKKIQLKMKNKEVSIVIDEEKKSGDELRRQIDEAMREKEILNKEIVSTDERSRRTVNLLKVYGNTKKNLTNEVIGFKNKLRRQQETKELLEQEVDRYDQEADFARQKYLTAVEELRYRETQIYDLQKKITEGENKLKQKQNLYEQVRSDRNMYSKHLIESKESIAELRRKYKIMNHQIEQLKDEITSKDHALVNEHFEHHKVEAEKENLRTQLMACKKKIQSAKQIITNQESETYKLNQIISEADEERIRQQKEFQAVVNERDILQSQLIQRNEELGKLYEKIKIQRSNLGKGEWTFRSTMNKIKARKADITKLEEVLQGYMGQCVSLDEFTQTIRRLDKLLVEEKTKITALTEELERPLNVHRWRKLEGSDPNKFELVTRIHSLHKTLINQTQEIVDKDNEIKEKEKLYIELKNVLARQPGPEVAEQLEVYQQNLKDKNRQMKAMKSELEMYTAQVAEYKFEIEGLIMQQKRVKEAFFAAMRKGELRLNTATSTIVRTSTRGGSRGGSTAGGVGIGSNDTRTFKGMVNELLFPGSGRLGMRVRNRRSILEKIAMEKCAPKIRTYVDCTNNEGRYMIWKCRDLLNQMNTCVSWYTTVEKVEEYWNAREQNDVPAWAAFTEDEKIEILKKESKKNWKQKKGSSIFPTVKGQATDIVRPPTRFSSACRSKSVKLAKASSKNDAGTSVPSESS
eukprot:g347.t1